MKEFLKHMILLVLISEFITGIFHVIIVLTGQEFYIIIYPIMAVAMIGSMLLGLILKPFAEWFLSLW
jgi:hypothetical protein